MSCDFRYMLIRPERVCLYTIEPEEWPAAAVIPAPIAYIKVVAVKKLVVELQIWSGGPLNGVFTAWLGLVSW